MAKVGTFLVAISFLLSVAFRTVQVVADHGYSNVDDYYSSTDGVNEGSMNREHGFTAQGRLHPLDMRHVTISFSKVMSIDILESSTSFCSTGADDTGLVVWGPSIALSQYLIHHPETISGKRVMELGCGAALPSMISYRLGAFEVVASDFRRQTLEQVQYHAQVNDCSVHTELLDWENPLTLADVNPDIVLAADVLYGLALVHPLVKTIEHILPKHASLLIATRDGRIGIPEFRQMMSVNFHEVEILISVDATYLPEIPKIIADDPLSRDRWAGSYSIFAYHWREKA